MDTVYEYTMLINFVCNIILCIAFTLFIIFVFGRPTSKMHTLGGAQSLGVKIGLAFCTVGALLNALTFSDPPISELILNIGLATLFTWAAWFHYFHFVKIKSKKATRTNRKNTKKK